ncbi:signal recognition particle subunit [Lambiella insularis]|nr:signal recognition particle subunit [Lambiella insularis]
MSFNPRIEEVSSSSDSDPSEMDPSDLPPSTIIRPAHIPSTTPASHLNPSSSAATQLQPQFRAPSQPSIDKEKFRTWQCLYPIYFDRSRSRAQGRRVGKELAVANPLAREIADAVGGLGLQVVFEVGKMHPKDWSNPGRVRVGLKEGRGGVVKNKHHLYILVSKHLQAHPTTEDTPFRAGMRIAGLPIPQKPVPPPAKPRGWKMNDILPLHSPAMSGGGVSENIFKEMMTEMQGGQPGMVEESAGGSSGGGGEGKKKKEKRKVIRG